MRWRGREEWERRKNEKGGKKRKKSLGRNSGKGRATNDRFKWSQANERGKLVWNNKNEEEFEETDGEICKIGKKIITGWELQETIGKEWKSETQEKRREKREGKEELRKRWQ